MSGWHPEVADGGLPPNPSDATNPIQAFPPIRPPAGTAALYYGNGCDVRLRPAVLNTLISENLALVDSVGLNYNPGRLTNTRLAVEYVVQKGLPKWVALDGGPSYYTGVLDPPLLHGHNNGMVLCVVPKARNSGFVRVDVGAGWVPVLRNDFRELQADDWPANVPQIIAYYNGAFYMLGLCQSQVPIVLKGVIGFWIRPDGNDATGDGTENTPGKAFRTIDGCWAAVGDRYAASPAAHLQMRLGIPGDYEAGYIGPYGATIWIIGDRNNPGAYRIRGKADDIGSWCLGFTGCNSVIVVGVELVITNAAPKPLGTQGLVAARSNVLINALRMTVTVTNLQAFLFWIVTGSQLRFQNVDWPNTDTVTINGGGHSVSTGMFVTQNSMMWGPGGGFNNHLWQWQNIHFAGTCYRITDMSQATHERQVISQSGVSGQRFVVADHSTIRAEGQTLPGNVQGGVGAFSTFYA